MKEGIRQVYKATYVSLSRWQRILPQHSAHSLLLGESYLASATNAYRLETSNG